MKDWFKESYRRCILDMHIADWDENFLNNFSADNYIKMLKRADVDAAIIYANSCTGISFYPTKVGHMHNGLKGRDVFRELTEGCRKAGIKPIAYINKWSKWAYDKNPEWRNVSPDGLESAEFMYGMPGRFGVLCTNSPYRDMLISEVKEVCENYDFDGLWIDMLTFHIMCTCKHCQKRFKEETGYDIPKVVDWEDKRFISYLRKREEWLAELFKEIADIARTIKPDISVVCNSGWYGSFNAENLDFYKIGDYTAGDFTKNRIEDSWRTKLLGTVSKNTPLECLVPIMDPDLGEHSIMKHIDKIKFEICECLTNNGRYGFIDAVDPSGTLNPKVYEKMGEVYSFEKRYEKYLMPDSKPCSDVAIYTNIESNMNPEDNGKPLQSISKESPHMRALRGTASILVDRHIPYGVISKTMLEHLSEYKLIILPEVYALDDREVQAFTEYVKNGGSLYLSGETGKYDGAGNRFDKGRLSALSGIEYTGKTTEGLTYIRPNGMKNDIIADYTKEHPLTINNNQVLVSAVENVNVYGYLTLPLVHPKDKNRFVSAISDPPGKETEYPSIVQNKYGKGNVMYSAAPIETQKKEDQIQVFVNMLSAAIKINYIFKTDAPKCVEITLHKQSKNNRYILNLLNYQSQLPNIPIYNFKVSVRLDDEIVKVFSAVDGEVLNFTKKDGYAVFEIPKLDMYNMYILEF